MLVIRLQRTGRKNLATYRIVVAEKARAAKGKFHEILGHYLPTQKDGVFTVDKERVSHWVKNGAIPSETVARLLKRNGVDGMDKFTSRYVKRRSKNAPPEEEAPAVPAPTPQAVPEAPAADVQEEPKVEESASPAPEEEKKVEEPKAENSPAA